MSDRPSKTLGRGLPSMLSSGLLMLGLSAAMVLMGFVEQLPSDSERAGPYFILFMGLGSRMLPAATLFLAGVACWMAAWTTLTADADDVEPVVHAQILPLWPLALGSIGSFLLIVAAGVALLLRAAALS